MDLDKLLLGLSISLTGALVIWLFRQTVRVGEQQIEIQALKAVVSTLEKRIDEAAREKETTIHFASHEKRIDRLEGADVRRPARRTTKP